MIGQAFDKTGKRTATVEVEIDVRDDLGWLFVRFPTGRVVHVQLDADELRQAVTK